MKNKIWKSIVASFAIGMLLMQVACSNAPISLDRYSRLLGNAEVLGAVEGLNESNDIEVVGINPSDEGIVGAWNPIYGRNIKIYAKGNVYTQPEFLDFTYNDHRPGGVIYCIQPGVAISSGDSMSASIFNDSYSLLTSEQRLNIQRVTGYMTYYVDYQAGQVDYNKQSLNYYWTYQFLIWYYCGAVSDEDVARSMSDNGVGIYEEYIRIRTLMNQYDTLPSYATRPSDNLNNISCYKLTMQPNGTYETILHDTSGLLRNGELQAICCDRDDISFIQCDQGGNASANGEYMKIVAHSYIDRSNPVVCTQTKQASQLPICNNNILLLNANSQHQNCIAIGSPQYIEIQGCFSVYTDDVGELTIRKIDRLGNDVKGAKLAIVKANGAVPAMDDEGNYQILQLPKVLNNAIVKDSKGEIVYSDAIWISDGTTHSFRFIPKGTYYIVELDTPKGYVSIDPIRISIPLEEDGVYGLGYNKYTENKDIANKDTANTDTVDCYAVVEDGVLDIIEDEIHVSISKQDVTTGEELPGAKLRIENSSKEVIDEWISEETPHMVEGHLLEVGQKYSLIEELPPNGYTYSQAIEFEVKDTKDIQKVIMYDELVQGRIRIIKTGEQLVAAKDCKSEFGIYKQLLFEQRPLEGAEFGIFDSKQQLLETIQTDANGIAESSSLAWGDYYVKEISAPDGFVIDENTHPVELKLPEGYTAPIYYEESIFQNDITSTQVDIYKVGEKRVILQGVSTIELQPLEGAVIALYARNDIRSVDGECVVQKDTCLGFAISNEKGIASICEKLVAGEYYYKEVSAPEGYEIDKGIYDVRVELTNGPVTIIDANSKEPLENHLVRKEKVSPESISTPKTGDKADLVFAFIALMLGFIGLFTLAINNLKKSKKK